MDERNSRRKRANLTELNPFAHFVERSPAELLVSVSCLDPSSTARLSGETHVAISSVVIVVAGNSRRASLFNPSFSAAHNIERIHQSVFASLVEV